MDCKLSTSSRFSTKWSRVHDDGKNNRNRKTTGIVSNRDHCERAMTSFRRNIGMILEGLSSKPDQNRTFIVSIRYLIKLVGLIHREGRWVAPDKFAGKNLPLFKTAYVTETCFSSVWRPSWLIFGDKVTKNSQKFSMKFYGPWTPKFTEYFACFTEWKIFTRKFVGHDPPSLPMD